MLNTDEKYGGDRHTKSYPKRKLLPEFDDEAIEPIPPKNNTADLPDRPPRGRDRAANDAAHKSATGWSVWQIDLIIFRRDGLYSLVVEFG